MDNIKFRILILIIKSIFIILFMIKSIFLLNLRDHERLKAKKKKKNWRKILIQKRIILYHISTISAGRRMTLISRFKVSRRIIFWFNPSFFYYFMHMRIGDSVELMNKNNERKKENIHQSKLSLGRIINLLGQNE